MGREHAPSSDERSERFGDLAYRVIRTRRYKLIDWQDPKSQDELYDLEADSHETRNRIDDPKLETALDELARRLHEWRVWTQDTTLSGSP